MALLPVIDTLFSLDSPTNLVSAGRCGGAIDNCVAAMDVAGIEKVVLAPCRHWECERHWVCGEIQIDEVEQCVAAYPTRFVGLAAYNPLAVTESLHQIDKAVRASDFRGVYVHTEGAAVNLREARMYPLYARCADLNVPLMIQLGNDVKLNRSLLADLRAVLLDFSEMHALLAWTGEADLTAMRVMCEQHPTVSVAFDGSVEPEQVREVVEWLNGEGQHRCMWGSNGLPWKKLLNTITSYSLRKNVLNSFLHDNAWRTFGLAQPARMLRLEQEPITVAD